MLNKIKKSVKSVPGLGSFVFSVKWMTKSAIDALHNVGYYTIANLSQSQRELLISDTSHTDSARRGLFSLFREVLDIISANGQRDIRVEYHHTLYNDSPNENMWEYYFYPVRNDVKKKYRHFFATRPYRNVFSAEDPLQLALFHEIIADRIRIKEDIVDKAERFWKKNLQGKKVIGVHYRGTDIYIPTKRYRNRLREPRLEDYFDAVEALLATKAYDTVFLATDEEKVLQRFTERYGEKLVYYPTERSVDGRALHIFNHNPRQQGEDVIIDALLLSRCAFFVYGCSNVATVVKYLNPSLPSKNMRLL